MIVLDTNVVSAIMQPDRNRPVVAWLDGQARDAIWITSVTVMEIRFGIELLDEPERRDRLTERFRLAAEKLEGRILSFDSETAVHAARLAAQRRRAGRPMSEHDVQIAGICLAHSAALATRNVRDFAATSIPLIDPWLTLA